MCRGAESFREKVWTNVLLTLVTSCATFSLAGHFRILESCRGPHQFLLDETYDRVTISAEAKFLTVSMATFRDNKQALYSIFQYVLKL